MSHSDQRRNDHNGGGPHKVILFQGYCKWRTGQLQREIQRGVWDVCVDATPEDILPTRSSSYEYANTFSSSRLATLESSYWSFDSRVVLPPYRGTALFDHKEKLRCIFCVLFATTLAVSMLLWCLVADLLRRRYYLECKGVGYSDRRQYYL